MLLIVFGNAAAQQIAPAASPPSLIDTSPGAISQPVDNSQSSDNTQNSQNSNNNQNQNNQQNNDNTQLPANPQVPVNPTPTTPLLPQQGLNAYQPFSTGYSSINNQPPEITAPNLYTTGNYNLSQIATGAALSQAFTQQGASDFYSEPGMSYSHPPIERVRIGPIDIKAALSANIVTDDNLRSGNGTTVNGTSGVNNNNNNNQGKEFETSYSVTPAVLFEYGDHEGQRGSVTLVYAPTITRFFSSPGENTDDQNVALSVQYPFQRLTLNASQAYSQTTGINVDTNTRTTQSSLASSAGASYLIDDKLSFGSSIQYAKTSFANPNNQNGGGNAGNGDETTSVNSSLSYSISDKLSVGSSVNFGVDKSDGSKQATYEQALLGVSYAPTAKISFYTQGGIELRQGGGAENNGIPGQPNTSNSSSDDTINPIFSLGVGYNPFDSTTLSLNASQSVYSSTDVTSDTVVATSVGLSATQRFFQRFFLNLSFNYDHNEDSGSGNSSFGSSSQDTFAYRAGLSYSPTLWSSLSLYYQYLENESNSDLDSYHDNQVGLSATVQF